MLKGTDNMCKQTEFRYEDGRKLDHKYMSPLRELWSICVHVPYPKKPGTTLPNPVFVGVYTNTDGHHSHTLAVIIVSDKAAAWSVYNKMSKCPFAWLHGHWVSLGYTEGMIRSIIEELGPNAYYMAKHASTFDQEILEVEVDFNENQPDIALLKVEREFGLEDDSVVTDAPEVQQRVVIEMTDARTLELFKG
jgi:hypothetical protein